MFSKGYPKQIRLEGNGARAQPPRGKKWFFMCGTVDHINLTETTVRITDIQGASMGGLGYVPAAEASGTYPIPNLGADAADPTISLIEPQVGMIVIEAPFEFKIVTGGAGVVANLLVWEFE